MRGCPRCVDAGGWVCENHPDRPWAGSLLCDAPEACECGAGMPCEACWPNNEMPHVLCTNMIDEEARA